MDWRFRLHKQKADDLAKRAYHGTMRIALADANENTPVHTAEVMWEILSQSLAKVTNATYEIISDPY
jgi:hypothetical protein